MRKLPPLSALRAFDAVARSGSVTAAAAELHRTHGAVSRQLRALQEHAGAALFARQGTGIVLNEAGQALQAIVGPLFDQLEDGYARVQQRARQPGLHVACSATFAMRWLVPHLADFYRDEPDIRIRLSMTSAREIRAEGADLLIAWDLSHYLEAERARALPLAPAAFGPVCRPGYDMKARGAVRITHEYTTSAWSQWQALTGRRDLPRREIAFPHTHLCIEAALGGLGVALVESRLVQKELADGSLVAPHGFTPFAGGMMALAAGEPDARARRFIAWLGQALQR
ncbi:LysR substrate-binding domain-containing protein [Bordetella genomosp. 1]|uniref:LysR family transcriptional regulator n=1 Tax=Bordetella genomosp. 1 TaxID=1395607 RepID=A0ABX4F3C3_9BORD|nr:LysR substrate-binding domain-containing protein [Bordetella genomosp. 1]OZI68259.1 LysR family transcriptional regulator [Bordetella genomosp. 1]